MAFDVQISLRPSRLREPSVGLYEKRCCSPDSKERILLIRGLQNPKPEIRLCHLSERKVFVIRVVGFGAFGCEIGLPFRLPCQKNLQGSWLLGCILVVSNCTNSLPHALGTLHPKNQN